MTGYCYWVRLSKTFLVAVLLLFVAGCAAKTTSTSGPTSEPSSRGGFFSESLKDEAALLKDSEFSIVFPREESPGIRTILVRAAKAQIQVSMNSTHKLLKSGQINTADYRDLLALIRQLDDKEFGRTVPANCREPYEFKFKLSGEQRVFVGCRGQGLNATIVSKIAREVEFRLLRSSTGWRSK